MLKKFTIISVFLAICFTAVPIMADDIDIFGTTVDANLQANVMIILDNSGSMNDGGSSMVPGDPYDPATVYAGTRTKDMVYINKNGVWSDFVLMSGLACATVKASLNANGTVVGKVTKQSGYDCNGNTDRSFATGNFLNYEEGGGGSPQYKYEVAKKAVISLLTDPANEKVRFGLMHFVSPYSGGYVKYKCGSNHTDMATYVGGMGYWDFNTGTPLAEALAEAGLYFSDYKEGGTDVKWFDPNSHPSPIQEPCQENHVIVVTDGEPTGDKDSKLYNTKYINIPLDPTKIKKISENYSDCASTNHCLDEVAEFLHDNDIHSSGSGSSTSKQYITTHTISFALNNPTAINLLQTTATKGGGGYHSAQSLSGLQAAFEQIMNKINEENAVYAAPAIPTNQVRRTSGGEWIYLSYFKPQQSGEWLGNLKKYFLGNGKSFNFPEGGSVVTDEDYLYGRDAKKILEYVGDEAIGILKTSKSFWTNVEDGGDTERGGAGYILNDRPIATNPRNIYFYNSGATSPSKELWDSKNFFKAENVSLGADEDEIIAKTLSPFTNWQIGSIIHSSPAVAHYSTTKSLVFVGANDGMLHCFDDTTGNEEWGFIPPGQIDRLSLLRNSSRDYYVDGSPTISEDIEGGLIAGTSLFQPETLIFGERRGGSRYYALDISGLTSNSEEVKYKYSIEPEILKNNDAGVNLLGQSWSKPIVCTISTATLGNGELDENALKTVFIMAGGYDVNQDLTTPNNEDTLGKAIFAVKADDGQLMLSLDHKNSGLTMKNCFVDVQTDSPYYAKNSNKEVTTRLYAGDLGGQVFVFADDIDETEIPNGKVEERVPNGTFPVRQHLFDAGAGKKIFYAPGVSSVSKETYEWVVFGTGDAEKPNFLPAESNRIYAIKNEWLGEVKESDLIDLTTEDLDVQKSTTDTVILNKYAAHKKDLDDAKGWFIDLEKQEPTKLADHAGEKVTSSPTIVNGVVFFSTYTPPEITGAPSTDPCNSGNVGKGRLYAIRIDDAIAEYDMNADDTKQIKERWREGSPFEKVVVNKKVVRIEDDPIPPPEKFIYDYYFWRHK